MPPKKPDTEILNFITSIRLKGKYKKAVQELGAQEHLKPAPFMQQILMKEIDRRVKKLKPVPAWAKTFKKT